MGWPKGKPRPPGAGRQPGSLNKRTLAEAACERAGIDPFDMLVAHAKAGDLGAVVQLCKHIEPPKKPLEVSGPDGKEIVVTVRRYLGRNTP